jgi:hypothetical protein
VVRDAEPGTSCGDPCLGVGTCQKDDDQTVCLGAQPKACDDGNACNGVETCDLATGDCKPGAPKVCDDGDVCNGVETCDPADGVCVSGDAAQCDDGSACSADSCDATDGCVHALVPGPGCCDADADCDDASPCTQDSCDVGTFQCIHTPVAGACDDGDPCTQGDRCDAGACVPETILPACSVLCSLAGKAGDVVDCPLRVARRFQEEGPATTMLASVRFDALAAGVQTLVDRVCLSGESSCSSVQIPEGGSTLFETNHTVYLTPEDPAAAAGDLGVSFENVVDPGVALTQAYWDGQKVVGDASLVALRFVLAADIPVAKPAPVLLYGVVAKAADGAALAIATVGDTIYSAEVGCGDSLRLCFDANPGTEDACDAPTTSCSYTAKAGEACDDGNPCSTGDTCEASGACKATGKATVGTACTGDDKCAEVGTCDAEGACAVQSALAVKCPSAPNDCSVYRCEPGTGECSLDASASGTPCDDGTLCTSDDACNGLGACVGATLDCNDGFDCTADHCEAATGCVHMPDNKACDDKNACTDEACTAGQGCVVTPRTGGTCDDADPCTTGDTCKAGTCAGTWDTPKCGCTTTADCAVLEDGNLCNGKYACVAKQCVIDPATVVKCPAYANDCVDHACVPATGLCTTGKAATGTTCEAADACALGGKCDATGACQPTELADCDDGDPCTQDSCNPDHSCKWQNDPTCMPKYVICEVSGAAGAVVDCPLQLARGTLLATPPSGANFKLAWDDTKIDLVKFEDQVCLGTVCLPKGIPTCSGGTPETNCVWGSLYPSGHNLVAVPQNLAGWIREGTLLMFHPSDPFKPITDAYMSPGDVLGGGDPLFLKARFKLTTAVPAATPVSVWMSNVDISLATGENLKVRIVKTTGGRLIVAY